MMWAGENGRFWFYTAVLSAFAVYSSQQLIRSHVDPQVSSPQYAITIDLPALRGSIYSSLGEQYPFVKSVPCWKYSLDQVAFTNQVQMGQCKEKGKPPKTKEEVVLTIATALSLDYDKVLRMINRPPLKGRRYQFLAISEDPDAHRTLIDSRQVAGIVVEDMQNRQYIHGRRLSHVLGSVNAENVGSAGIEQRYNRELSGVQGKIVGMKDARGRELYDRREISISAINGNDIYLTIDPNLQYCVESELRRGMDEYGADSGWSIVMDAKTGAILAMVSYPDFHPLEYGKLNDNVKINRAIGYNYEPGSVMKVITLASAIEAGFAKPGQRYSTNRYDERYYKLPGDGSHVWEPTMTLADAIVHSSNIVIGKLGYDFGPLRLYEYMRRFGFGQKTGIELPGEEKGQVPNPNKKMWDKASRSRAAIGQFVSVTALQLINAYQAIANDGQKMKPYIIDKIVAADGTMVMKTKPTPTGRPISEKTAKTMREIMKGVATPTGTARRAAIKGYSVAGKTGTAQKVAPGGKGYLPNLYRATFCGMLPADEPRLVILVTLDFERRTTYHQGGNSAGPIFRRIGEEAVRQMMIQPDKPDELYE